MKAETIGAVHTHTHTHTHTRQSRKQKNDKYKDMLYICYFNV